MSIMYWYHTTYTKLEINRYTSVGNTESTLSLPAMGHKTILEDTTLNHANQSTSDPSQPQGFLCLAQSATGRKKKKKGSCLLLTQHSIQTTLGLWLLIYDRLKQITNGTASTGCHLMMAPNHTSPSESPPGNLLAPVSYCVSFQKGERFVGCIKQEESLQSHCGI